MLTSVDGIDVACMSEERENCVKPGPRARRCGLADPRECLKLSLVGSKARFEAASETSNSETDDDQSIASEEGDDIQVWPDTASEDDYDDLCCRVHWSGGRHIFSRTDMSIITDIGSGHSTAVSSPEGDAKKLSRSTSDEQQPKLSCRSWSDISESTGFVESGRWTTEYSTTPEDNFPPIEQQVKDDVAHKGDARNDSESLAWASDTKSDFESLADDQMCSNRDTATTLMVRNLPETVTQLRFIEELKRTGFENMFDFCYVPTRSFKYHQGVGFAFVNFVNSLAAKVFLDRWHKSRRFNMRSGASWLNVSRARVQGRDANMNEAGSSRMLRIRNRSFKPFCTDLTDADPVAMDQAIRELMKRKPDESEWQCYDEQDHDQESWKPVGASREQEKNKHWRSETTAGQWQQQWRARDGSSSSWTRRSKKVHYTSQR